MTMPIRIPWPQLKRSMVAILRGLKPDEAAPVVEALIEEGFEAIEIPLNSPDPFRSIETAARLAPARVLIGAGTVLAPDDADRLADLGGRLLVSPNVDPAVIARASVRGLVTMPGVMTPTEAFQAIAAGASALKFFPAGLIGPAGIGAIRAVLPREIELGAVGNVSEADFADYARIGLRTFGLGSSLYRPGFTADEVRARARRIRTAYDEVFTSA